MREPDALLHNEGDGHAHDEPPTPPQDAQGSTNPGTTGTATAPMKKPRDHVDDPARPHTH